MDGNWADSDTKTATFSDLKSDIFALYLEVMYTGKLSVLDTTVYPDPTTSWFTMKDIQTQNTSPW